MLKIVKPSEIESVIGTETGLSEWITIDQEQINKFAEATLDNQFIHVDPEAAKVPVDSEVRIRMECLDITEKNPGQFLAKTKVTMEIKGVEKPAYIAETLSMYVL